MGFTPKLASQFFDDMDMDGDNSISPEEFQKLSHELEAFTKNMISISTIPDGVCVCVLLLL